MSPVGDSGSRGSGARAVRPRVVPICLAALAFVGVGVIRFSLIAVIAVLAPAAVLFSWKSDD